MRIAKKVFLCLFIALFLHVCCAIYFHFGDNFHHSDFEHGFKTRVEIAGLDYSQLDTILNQPFHYLGNGAQMTAYESADGKYVFKLFHPRKPHKLKWYFKWSNWQSTYSFKHIFRQWLHTEKRLEKMYRRLAVAFAVMREETGLVFLYLSPSDRVNHTVHLIDKKGKPHHINLHQTPFLLQKKAIMAIDYFDALARDNKIDELKVAMARMDELFAKRLRMALTDQNQNMEINYGFVDGYPVQIDVGSLQIDPVLLVSPQEEQRRITENFHNWMKNRYPSIL